MHIKSKAGPCFIVSSLLSLLCVVFIAKISPAAGLSSHDGDTTPNDFQKRSGGSNLTPYSGFSGSPPAVQFVPQSYIGQYPESSQHWQGRHPAFWEMPTSQYDQVEKEEKRRRAKEEQGQVKKQSDQSSQPRKGKESSSKKQSRKMLNANAPTPSPVPDAEAGGEGWIFSDTLGWQYFGEDDPNADSNGNEVLKKALAIGLGTTLLAKCYCVARDGNCGFCASREDSFHRRSLTQAEVKDHVLGKRSMTPSNNLNPEMAYYNPPPVSNWPDIPGRGRHVHRQPPPLPDYLPSEHFHTPDRQKVLKQKKKSKKGGKNRELRDSQVHTVQKDEYAPETGPDQYGYPSGPPGSPFVCGNDADRTYGYYGGGGSINAVNSGYNPPTPSTYVQPHNPNEPLKSQVCGPPANNDGQIYSQGNTNLFPSNNPNSYQPNSLGNSAYYGSHAQNSQHSSSHTGAWIGGGLATTLSVGALGYVGQRHYKNKQKQKEANQKQIDSCEMGRTNITCNNEDGRHSSDDEQGYNDAYDQHEEEGHHSYHDYEHATYHDSEYGRYSKRSEIDLKKRSINWSKDE